MDELDNEVEMIKNSKLEIYFYYDLIIKNLFHH